MNKSRLRYLRNRVVEHIQGMPQKEDVDKHQHNDATGAVFDLQYFQITDGNDSSAQEDEKTSIPLAEHVKNVTSNYECGFRGCFAGWYALLSQKDGLLTETELITEGLTRHQFDYQHLAAHFEISYNESKALFASFGGGYELIHVAEKMQVKPEAYHPDHAFRLLQSLNTTHKQVLDLRIGFLDKLLDERETGIDKYWSVG
jgi:hypothetical protein